MCNCVDVKMGSYDNQRTIPIPTHMGDYKRSRASKGLSGFISVDRCCIPQLIHLWKNGISTYGCCCGHNIAKGFINVGEKDFDKALSLGYTKYRFDKEPFRADTIEYVENTLVI